MNIRGMLSMKNKTACIKLFCKQKPLLKMLTLLFCKQKPLLKNIPIVFLLVQVFFFLKRKSVFTHISLKGRDMMLGISLGI